MVDEFIVDSVKREETELRCHSCKSLITKLFIITSVPVEIRKVLDQNHITISQAYPEIEIKIGTETKCRRCKKLDYKLAVI